MKKASINEDFSILRKPSPYKIERDKGFVRDATHQMNMNYLLRRAEEEQNFIQKQKMFGDMEKLEPLVVSLFRHITDMRNFIMEQQAQPLIEKPQYAALGRILKGLDKIAKYVSTTMLEHVDELTAKQETQEDVAKRQGLTN